MTAEKYADILLHFCGQADTSNIAFDSVVIKNVPICVCSAYLENEPKFK